MKELIELISSVTVLIAAMAGISAVNKWKKERFDKAKIEAIEKYEESLRDFNKRVAVILDQDDLSFDFKEGRGIDDSRKKFSIFCGDKEKKIKDLKNKYEETKKNLDIYSGYAGNKLSFSDNYYYSTCMLMNQSVLFLSLESWALEDKSSISSKPSLTILVVEFLDNNKALFDVVDYMLISSPKSIFMIGGYDKSVFIDRRGLYKDVFLNIVSAEKMMLHSSFFEKILVKVKTLIMKHRVIGRVLCISDKKALVVGVDGEVIECNAEGKDYKILEKTHREKIFRKLAKLEIKRIFS